eukprot:212612-Chlamydomonas_euryale.AAC.1
MHEGIKEAQSRWTVGGGQLRRGRQCSAGGRQGSSLLQAANDAREHLRSPAPVAAFLSAPLELSMLPADKA